MRSSRREKRQAAVLVIVRALVAIGLVAHPAWVKHVLGALSEDDAPFQFVGDYVSAMQEEKGSQGRLGRWYRPDPVRPDPGQARASLQAKPRDILVGNYVLVENLGLSASLDEHLFSLKAPDAEQRAIKGLAPAFGSVRRSTLLGEGVCALQFELLCTKRILGIPKRQEHHVVFIRESEGDQSRPPLRIVSHVALTLPSSDVELEWVSSDPVPGEDLPAPSDWLAVLDFVIDFRAFMESPTEQEQAAMGRWYRHSAVRPNMERLKASIGFVGAAAPPVSIQVRNVVIAVKLGGNRSAVRARARDDLAESVSPSDIELRNEPLLASGEVFLTFEAVAVDASGTRSTRYRNEVVFLEGGDGDPAEPRLHVVSHVVEGRTSSY